MSKINWKLYEGTKNPRSMRSFESFWNLLESEGYEMISSYKKNSDKVTLRCPHNHEFKMRPNDFKSQSQRCPICSGRNKEYAKEQFEKLLKDEGYTLLNTYTNNRTKVKMRCPQGHTFDTTPSSFKNIGSRCPICQGLSSQYAKQEFEKLLKDEGYKLLTPYKGTMKKVKLKCPRNHEFDVSPNSFKNSGSRCPICQGSYGERTTYDYLQSIHLDFEIQKTFEGLRGVNGGVLRYDFYIPSLNLLLEIQGKQHYESVGLFGGEEQLLIQMENDRRKRLFAKALGMNLVSIKCYGEEDEERLKEELQSAIDEALYRYFGKAS